MYGHDRIAKTKPLLRNFCHWCTKSKKFYWFCKILHNTSPLNGLLSLKRAYSRRDLLLWFAGQAIKCYQCRSPKSWDDCVPGKDTTCASHQNSCVKVKIEGEKDGKNVNYFVKECVEKKTCNKNDGCKPGAQRLGMKFKDCDFNCCETDLCNGAKVPMVSSFLFLACALVANFR